MRRYGVVASGPPLLEISISSVSPPASFISLAVDSFNRSDNFFSFQVYMKKNFLAAKLWNFKYIWITLVETFNYLFSFLWIFADNEGDRCGQTTIWKVEHNSDERCAGGLCALLWHSFCSQDIRWNVKFTRLWGWYYHICYAIEGTTTFGFPLIKVALFYLCLTSF